VAKDQALPATDTADAAKQKAGETAQFIQDKAADAVQYAKGPAAADKDATPATSAASTVALVGKPL
jgi:hypothetical protein